MTGEILLEHTIPITLLLAAAIGSLLIGAYSFRRHLPKSPMRRFLAAVRLLFLLLIIWCLIMPVLRKARQHLLKPRFLVILDTSRSMTMTPGEDITTRWQTACEILTQPWTRSVSARSDVHVYPFSADPGSRVNLEDVSRLRPEGEATYLRSSLRRITERYRGQHVAGILLLSDGIDTRETTSEWAAEDWPYPIHTVRLEPPDIWEVEPDIRVDAVNTPRRVLIDRDTELSAVISGQGTGGAEITVQLFKDDEPAQEIPTRIPAGGGSREVHFRLSHDTAGHYTYTVNLPPLPGETNTNDNFLSVSVIVADDTHRLLYVEGVPRWESKYLNRVLQAGTLVESLSFIRGPDGQFLTHGIRGSMTTDMTEEELKFFNILVLGDLDGKALGEERAANILQFVEDGGSLVLLGGSRAWGGNGFQNTALRRLLPLRSSPMAAPAEGRFRAQITEEGLQHPVMGELRHGQTELPPLLSYFPGGEISAGATALVLVEDTGESQPLIAVQRYGNGRVAAILTDSLWRWQLQPGAGNIYADFWNSLISWMIPAEAETDEYHLDLYADRDQLYMGENILLTARAATRGEIVSSELSTDCEILTPSGRRIPFNMRPQAITDDEDRTVPGFAVDFKPDEPGMHRAVAETVIGDHRTESAPFSFYVRPFTPESNPRPINAELLKALAGNSDGRFLEPDETNEFLSSLTMTPFEESRVEFHSLWNNWWILMGLIILIGTEWAARKRKNMA